MILGNNWQKEFIKSDTKENDKPAKNRNRKKTLRWTESMTETVQKIKDWQRDTNRTQVPSPLKDMTSMDTGSSEA